jgi:hypothetical protein
MMHRLQLAHPDGSASGRYDPMSANGMVRPCSCPASEQSWEGVPKLRSTPCHRHSALRSP